MSTRWSKLPALSARNDALTRVVVNALLGGASVAVAARCLAALLVNVPATPGVAPLGPLTVASTLLAGSALLTVGLQAGTPSVGVGPLFAGVFGILAVVAPAATVPAAVALGGGVATFVTSHRAAVDRVQGVALALVVVALASSLWAGVTGVASARTITSTFSLVALGTLPVFVTTDRWSLVRAAVAFVAVVGFGLTLPFVTGAVTLVGTGSVGTPLTVVAFAVAGVVTAASAAFRARRWQLLAAITLLGVAGVPATLGRAVPFALGITTLVRAVSR